MKGCLRLKVIAGYDRGREIAVPPEGALLGRGADAGIAFDDLQVSKLHCRIRVSGGKWLVEDLGSANGTVVNEVGVPVSDLHPGDTLALGGVRLRVLTPSKRPPLYLLVPAGLAVLIALIVILVASFRDASDTSDLEPDAGAILTQQELNDPRNEDGSVRYRSKTEWEEALIEE